MNWPDITFPPINLWSAPKLGIKDATEMSNRHVLLTFEDSNKMKQFMIAYNKRKRN